MNLLPMNGSQIHSIEYQQGLRDDEWVPQSSELISIDPVNITGMIQRAITSMAEHEKYTLAVKKWLARGPMVDVKRPVNILPNIPISHSNPFGGGVVGGSRYLTYPELQNPEHLAESIVRRQYTHIWFGHNWRYSKNDRSRLHIVDDLLIIGSKAREHKITYMFRDETVLGGGTSINCSFNVGSDYAVGDVDVCIRALGGIVGPSLYAETLVGKLLFEKASL